MVYSALVSAVTLALASTALMVYDAGAFRRALVLELTTDADIAGRTAASALAFGDPEFASNVLASLGTQPRVVAACIYDGDGEVFARYVRQAEAYQFPAPADAPGSRFGENFLDVSRPVLLAGTRVGTIYVRSDLAALARRRWRYAVILAGVMVLSLALALPFSLWLQRPVARPIQELTRVARMVSEEEVYSERAARFGEGELGALTDAFNDMLTQIQLREQERDKAQAELRRADRELTEGRLAREVTAVSTIIDGMLRGEPDDADTERHVLNACLEATGSQYGMIGVVNEHGKFDTTSYGSRTLEDCAFPEALTWDMTTRMTIGGIWGQPLLSGEPLLCNDLAAHPARAGYPEGHVPIDCFLGIPFMRDGTVAGMLAVANKPGGYVQEDQDTLVRLASAMAVSRRHRVAVLESARTQGELERLVGERTDELRQAVNLMSGREVRMAELKGVIKHLSAQIEEAGMTPVTGGEETKGA